MKNKKLVSRNPVQRFQWGQKLGQIVEESLPVVGPYLKILKSVAPGLYNDWGLGNSAQYKKLYRGARDLYHNDAKRAINEGAGRTAIFTARILRNNSTPTVNNGTPARNGGGTYYATRAYRGRIPVSGLNSREAVKAFQQRIGMTGHDLDGIWGNRTQAAYERWKNKNNSFILPSDITEEENAILNTPTTAPAPTSTVNLTEITPQMLGSDAPTYSPNAPINSPSINNWIAKAKGLKDLKYTLNPIFTNQTLLAKKGGQLISKNPIERFKRNGNFI